MLLAGAAYVTQQLCFLQHWQTGFFSKFWLTGVSGCFADVPSQWAMYTLPGCRLLGSHAVAVIKSDQ